MQKPESALHYIWTINFGRNRTVYLGWQAKMSTASEGNYAGIFIICKLEFCQGPNSEPQPLLLMPWCLFWLWILILVLYLFHTGTTGEWWPSVSSEAEQSVADWQTPLSLLPKHHWSWAPVIGKEWVATTHFKPMLFHHWVLALTWRDHSETTVSFH